MKPPPSLPPRPSPRPRASRLLVPLALLAGVASGQTTITFTNGQNSSTSYDTGSGALIFTIASGTATQSGTVSGSGGITKTGAGTLQLTGAVDNSALTAIVNAGTLVLGKTSSGSVHAIGGGDTSVTINNGGTVQFGGTGGDQIFAWASVVVNTGGLLDLNGRNEGFNCLTGTGTVTNTASTTSTLTLGENNGTSSFAGTLQNGAGTLAFTKTGTGLVALSGASTYTGPTTVAAGTLRLDYVNALPVSTALTVAAGASFLLNGQNQTIGSLSGGGSIDLSYGTLTVGGDNTSTTFSGVLDDRAHPGAFVKTGSGTLTLSNTNGLSLVARNGVTINGGTLALTGFGLFYGPLYLENNASLVLAPESPSTGYHVEATQLGDFSRPLSGNISAGLIKPDGPVVIKSGTYDARFLSSYPNARLWIGGDPNATVTLNGTNDLPDSAGQYAVQIGHSNTGSAGIVKIGNAQALSNWNHNVAVLAGTLDLNGVADVRAATILLGGNGTSSLVNQNTASAASFSNPTSLSYTNDIGGAGRLSLGNVSGSGGINKIGAGTLTLLATNTYTGPTTVSAGTLETGPLASPTITLANATALTFNLNADFSYAGVISGFGTFTKTGGGVLTLTGGNTFFGARFIDGGTLKIAGAGQLGTGSVYVRNGATLDLGGTTQTIQGLGNFGNRVVGNLTNGTLNATSGDFALQAGVFDVSFSGSVSNFAIGGDPSATVTLNGINDLTSGSGNLLLIGHSATGAAGTVKIGNANALGAASQSVRLYSGTLDFNGIAGVRGAAINLLDGAASILVNSNTASAASFAGAIRLTDGQMNTVGGAGDLNFSGVLSGEGGGFTKTGAGTLTLGGANTYTGGTTVSQGTLALGASNRLADSGAVTINGGTLALGSFNETVGAFSLSSGSLTGTGTLTASSFAFSNPGAATVTTPLAGAGSLTKTGTGSLTLGGANTYTGGTTVSQGTLALGASNRLVDTGAVTINGGTLALGSFSETVGAFSLSSGSLTGTGTLTASSFAFSNPGAATVTTPLAGAGSLTKTGAGTLTLSGANTYTGGTTVSQGTLQIGSGGTTGSLAGNVTNDAALTFNRSDALAFPGVISGAGSLTKTGAGTLTLSGANTHTGGTTISAGSLQIGNGGTAGSLAGNITNNAALAFNRSDALAFPGVISGSGNLTKAGAGTLTLTGLNNYTGSTTVSAGTLALAGSGQLGSGAVFVRNQATLDLGGTSQAIGDLGAFGSGVVGTIGAGTLTTTGYVVLESGVSNATFNGTGTNARLWIGGDATATVVLNGTNNRVFTSDHNQVIIGFPSATNGAGTVKVGNANALAAATENVAVFSGVLDLNGVASVRGNSVTLQSGSASALVNNNTGGGASFAGAVTLVGTGSSLGGAGDLSLSGALSGGGSLTKTGAGTLTLSGANSYTGGTTVSQGTLQIGSGGTAGSLAGNVTNDAALTFSRSDALAFSGAISGSGSLTKAGVGTLTLTGANTHTGGTTISAGSLQIGNGGTTGSLAGNITNNAALIFNRSDATSYSGVISGTGSLTKSGAGTLTLTGVNTATGATTISQGTLALSGSGRLADTTALTIASGATFNLNGLSDTLGSLAGAGSVVSTGTGTLTAGGDNTSTTFSGSFSGAGLIKAGTGTLTLTGTYGGLDPTISGGTLQVGTGGTAGSIGSASVTNQGSLVFNRSDIVIYVGQISGTGSVTHAGPGTLLFTNSAGNAYAGGTTITGGGTLAVARDLSLGQFSGALRLDNGTLDISNNDTFQRSVTLNAGGGTLAVAAGKTATWDGVFSGAGNLTKTGDGSLTLLRDNSFTGTTTISAGTLFLGGGVTNTGSVVSSSIVNQGTLVFQQPSATLTYSGVISGSGAVKVQGTSLVVRFTGDNTYTGTTTVTGTLRLGDGATSGWLASPSIVLNAGSLVFDRSDSRTYAGAISGTSNGVTKLGASTLTLTGASTYTGTTTISAGTLRIGDGGTTGSVANTLSIASGASLVFNRGDAQFTHAGFITGAGSVTKEGPGILILSRSNSYSGGTTLARGTLRIATADNLGNDFGALTFAGGTLNTTASFQTSRATVLSAAGTFDVDAGTTLGLLATVSGPGSLTKTGGGVLKLTGAQTYSGATVISAGTLQFATTNALYNNQTSAWTSANLRVDSGATLAVNAEFFQFGSTQLDMLKSLGSATGGFQSGSFLGIDTSNGAFTYNSAIANPNGGLNSLGLVKLGSSVLTLGGANTYSGDTRVDAGTLRISSAGALSPNTRFIVASGASLDLNGTPLSGSASIANEGATLTVSQNTSSTYSGTLSGTSGLTKSGTGTLTLSGANTYSGGTTVSAGTLAAGHSSAFGTGAVRLDAGTLDLGGYAIANALDVRGGSLTGLANYTGTQTLRSAATYSGSVGGALVLASGGSLNTTGAAFTGSLNVQNGATLAGTGTVGFATIASGGTIAPGNSPGTLTFTNGLTLDAGSILDFQLGSTSDLIRITGGTLTGPSSGTVTLNFSDAGGFAAGHYTLFDFSTGGTTTNNFDVSDFALGSTIAGFNYQLSQVGSTLQLTASSSASAVPEPSTYALWLGAAALLVVGRNRLRRPIVT